MKAKCPMITPKGSSFITEKSAAWVHYNLGVCDQSKRSWGYHHAPDCHEISVKLILNISLLQYRLSPIVESSIVVKIFCNTNVIFTFDGADTRFWNSSNSTGEDN